MHQHDPLAGSDTDASPPWRAVLVSLHCPDVARLLEGGRLTELFPDTQQDGNGCGAGSRHLPQSAAQGHGADARGNHQRGGRPTGYSPDVITGCVPNPFSKAFAPRKRRFARSGLFVHTGCCKHPCSLEPPAPLKCLGSSQALQVRAGLHVGVKRRLGSLPGTPLGVEAARPLRGPCSRRYPAALDSCADTLAAHASAQPEHHARHYTPSAPETAPRPV